MNALKKKKCQCWISVFPLTGRRQLQLHANIQQVCTITHLVYLGRPQLCKLVSIFKVITNGTMKGATGAFALVCWLHTHSHGHSVAPYTQNDVTTYKNLFVTSSKWLWNAFERHSIARDNHSKQLERSSAKRVGWGLIQRLLVVDWVYSSKRDGQVDMEFFFF